MFLEVGLRLSDVRVEQARRSTVFEPGYGTVRRDSWMFGFSTPPGVTEVNVHGQRVRLPKPAGETRMLFVGDSGTEGVLIGPEQTFPQVYAQRVARPGLVAINAGVFGMTTLDELHFFRTRLRALDPDWVVLGLFMSNDINFNLGHIAHEHSLRSRVPAWNWLVSHSALVHMLSAQWLIRTGAPLMGAEPTRGPGSVGSLVDPNGLHMLSYPLGEIATYVKRPSPLMDRAFAVLHTALAQFQALAEEDGFRFAVLIIPSPSAVAGRLRLLHYPHIYEQLQAAGIPLSEVDLDTGLPTRRVLRICDGLGITCVDPTRRFAAMGQGVFFPTDEHPTALGHAILAEALAEGLH